MRVDVITIRPAKDLAAAGTVDIVVPCRGARMVVLNCRATNANAPASLSAAEQRVRENGNFQTALAAFVAETGDAIGGQTLNNSTYSHGDTTATGRTRVYAAPSGLMVLPFSALRVLLTGHATLVIAGLEVTAIIYRPDVVGVVY